MDTLRKLELKKAGASADSAREDSAEIFQLAYWSRSQTGGGAPETQKAIDDILAVSRHKNDLLKITGALMFSDGYFAQVLEGPRPAVEAVFESIKIDTRHTHVLKIFEKYTASRDFELWSMAYVGKTSLKDVVIDPPYFNAGKNLSSYGVSLLEMLRYMVREQSED